MALWRRLGSGGSNRACGTFSAATLPGITHPFPPTLPCHHHHHHQHRRHLPLLQYHFRRRHIHTSHYEILQLTPEATYTEIKGAYLKVAQEYHPDRNKEDGAALVFQAASEAHEILKDASKRKMYDNTLVAPSSITGAPAASGWKKKPITMLEAELRAAVESGNVDAAVDKWVAAGSSLKILLYLIKLFQQHEHVPSSLPHVLKSLHAADPNTNGQANRTSGSNQQVPLSTESAVSAFIERKTMAYNELIRLCHICKQKEQLFEVLDEMESNKIDLDMATFAVLEDAFSWKS